MGLIDFILKRMAGKRQRKATHPPSIIDDQPDYRAIAKNLMEARAKLKADKDRYGPIRKDLNAAEESSEQLKEYLRNQRRGRGVGGSSGPYVMREQVHMPTVVRGTGSRGPQ